MKKLCLLVSVFIVVIGLFGCATLTQPIFKPYDIVTPHPILSTDLVDTIINLTDFDITDKIQKQEYKKIGEITQDIIYKDESSYNEIKNVAKMNKGNAIMIIKRNYKDGPLGSFGIHVEVLQLK